METEADERFEKVKWIDTNDVAHAGVKQDGIDWLNKVVFDDEGNLKGEDQLDMNDPEVRRAYEEAKARQLKLLDDARDDE